MFQLDDLVPETTSNGETEMRTARDILTDKHPKGRAPSSFTLLEGIMEPTNPILFDGLNADTILQVAMHTQGAAGPSGLDAQAWRRMCSSFKSASTNLLLCISRYRQAYSNHSNPSGRLN